jgi:hypothetical protein
MGWGLGVTRRGQPETARLTTGYSIGMMADPHYSYGSSARHARIATAMNLILDNATGLCALLAAGDLNERPEFVGFKEWALGEDVGWPAIIPILPCVGNHDAEIATTGTPETTPASPHATLLSRYSDLFCGHEWFTWDAHLSGVPVDLRVISLDNLTDAMSEDPTPVSLFYNCNPPGHQYVLNDDYSGFTSGASPQRNFLANAIQSKRGWKILMMHRGLWLPFDSSDIPLHRDARPILADAVAAGCSVLLQGHAHMGVDCGPWHPSGAQYETYVAPAANQVGIRSLCFSGGYTVRAINDTVLPNHVTTCHLARGSADSTTMVHAAILQFDGNTAALKVYEVSAAVPAGALIYEATIYKNPGS